MQVNLEGSENTGTSRSGLEVVGLILPVDSPSTQEGKQPSFYENPQRSWGPVSGLCQPEGYVPACGNCGFFYKP